MALYTHAHMRTHTHKTQGSMASCFHTFTLRSVSPSPGCEARRCLRSGAAATRVLHARHGHRGLQTNCEGQRDHRRQRTQRKCSPSHGDRKHCPSPERRLHCNHQGSRNPKPVNCDDLVVLPFGFRRLHNSATPSESGAPGSPIPLGESIQCHSVFSATGHGLGEARTSQ